jgi:glycosyltransferase involved in cell wall biosynthesis
MSAMSAPPQAAALELIVPAYNEERRLGPTLDALAAHLATLSIPAVILVVDNGSIDRTAALCRAPRAVPVSVIGCARQGKGAAIRRGIERSTARWVGYCDADLATAPSCLDTAVGALIAGHGAVVGARTNPASHVEVRASRLRHFGAWLFRRIAATVVPEVSETQCGFKFFDGDVARRAAADMVATGFAFDVELLARVRRLSPLVEIPVDWVDVAGSTFSIRRDGVPAFRELAAIHHRARALPPLPVPTPQPVVEPAVIRIPGVPTQRQPVLDLTAADPAPAR